jgi:signal transduction histidine kinase
MKLNQHNIGVLEVLVVDDIEASRVMLGELVQGLGHTVTVAAGGAAALEAVRQQPPDLILLDLLMPDIDGYEVTRRLRALCGDRWVPVVVTSSLQGDEHFSRALRQGADDYLARPVNADLLEAKLRHYAHVLALQNRLAGVSQRQRDIYDNIRDAVVTLDEQGRVCDLNLSACRQFGDGTPVGLLRQPCSAVLGAGLDTLLQQREVSLRRSDGQEFPSELGVSEWFDGGERRYTLVVRDLTERRQVERMKDEFLASVSHELRTPLTSILGAVGLLGTAATGALPPAAMRLTEVAVRNGERLGRLIDDLLDLTKIESDRLVLNLQPRAMAELLLEAAQAHQAAASQVQVRLESTAGPADGELRVRVDSDRFLQVLDNLISNALKHSPPQSVVTLGLDATPERVRAWVRDRGPGIPAEFRQRMFEKFSQADGSDQRVRGGTGLGLYLTRQLVERMGGSIRADEVSGEGAQFSIEFPRAELAQAPPTVQLWHIDRDLDARRRVASWLEGAYRMRDADSLQAIEPAGTSACVVVADPVGQRSADEFCAGLRRLAAGGPVLLYSDAVDEAFARRMGMVWLRKSTLTREGFERSLRDATASLATRGRA